MQELIIQWGAVVASATSIFSVLIWVYKKLIVEPNRRLEKKLHKENNLALERTVIPLTQSIDKLNYLLDESEKDRKVLHERDNQQEIVLDDHETRISVLEDWRKRRRD